ncbi:MAG: hypothetical protein J6S67_12750 [Methanobrevibacter sp.]|nr:hypothetical protein [Methanobrevibacter sp.]
MTIMHDKTLKDIFPTAIDGNGIFTEIAKIEWFEGLDQASFDEYFILTVGDKIAANKMQFFIDSDGHCTGDKLTKLAHIIWNVNCISWRNIYRDLTVQYNPIENTDYTETLKEKATSSGDASTESTGSGGGSSTVNNDKFGFNSSPAVHDTVIGTSEESSSTANTATETSNENNVDRTIRKHGNIGSITNAEIITKDLTVWQNKIADRFIQDICDIIALSIY